jgi:hypothetical protein
MKLNCLKSFTHEELAALEYRDEAEHAKFKSTKNYPKEVPFIKNNPRQVEA